MCDVGVVIFVAHCDSGTSCAYLRRWADGFCSKMLAVHSGVTHILKV
jgi:hypothetical protein